jgi:DNA-binding MarR family transcriptional regulator
MTVNFGLDNLSHGVWLLLHQTHDAVLKCEDKVFGRHGLTTEQHAVLLAMKYIDGPATPTRVARWLGRNPNSVSMIVDRMVKVGLVRRIRDLPDRRAVRLVIASKGKEMLDRATVAGWELVQELLSVLSEEDMRSLSRLLELVRGEAIRYLNPGDVAEEIRLGDASNMARFMKRVARYGSGSAPAARKQDTQTPA